MFIHFNVSFLVAFNVVSYFSHLEMGFHFTLLPHLLPKIDLTATKKKSSDLPEFL